MRGLIQDCCADGRRFAVKTEAGCLIVYAARGKLDWGDAVEGNFSAHGPASLYNQRTREMVEVYIEALGVDPGNIDFYLNLRR